MNIKQRVFQRVRARSSVRIVQICCICTRTESIYNQIAGGRNQRRPVIEERI